MRLDRSFELAIREAAQVYESDHESGSRSTKRAFEAGAYWALRAYTERLLTRSAGAAAGGAPAEADRT